MKKMFFWVFTLIIFTGCASTPQPPVSFNAEKLSPDATTVGVVFESPEAARCTYPGASCLLCLAAAATANSKLSSHTKTLSIDGVEEYKRNIIESLESEGFIARDISDVVEIKNLKKFKSDVPDTAKRDYRFLKEDHGITHLLHMKVNYIGFQREYSSYIPTTAPYATISGSSYMVDLEDNTYDWYHTIANQKFSEGTWKEGPSYPGLTEAYYSLIEETRERLETELGSE